MKKYLLIIFLFGSIISFAQNHFVGVQSGINYSNIDSKSSLSGYESHRGAKSLSSFSVGFVYEYRFKKGILFGSGIQYERKAYEDFGIYFPEDSDYVWAVSKSTNDFVGVPIKIGYSFGEKWSGFVYLGLQTSYLLKAYKYYSYMISEDKYDKTGDLNRFELGGIIELGTGYMITNRLNLFLNSSYLHAFTDISKVSNLDQKLLRINLSLGIKYALKAVDQ